MKYVDSEVERDKLMIQDVKYKERKVDAMLESLEKTQ